MCSGSGQRYGADMEDSGLGFSSLLTVGAFLNLCIYTCMRVRVFVCVFGPYVNTRVACLALLSVP